MKKRFLIIIALIFLVFIAPAYVVSQPAVLWQNLNDDTITPLNETYNVSIGKNDTTTYKLFVNGSFYANYLYGDGQHLANTPQDGYAGDMGHPHNQNLNTTNSPTFKDISLSDYPNLDKDSTDDFDGYAGDMGHPHNQDLNTSNNVQFNDITGHYFIGSGTQLTFNFIGCRVYKSANQWIPSGVWTKVILNLENYDSGNAYDNLVGMRYVVPETGYYQIGYSLLIDQMPDLSYGESAIYINGVQAGGYNKETCSTPFTTTVSLTSTDTFYLTYLNTIELYIAQNSGVNKQIFGGSSIVNSMYINKVDIN